MAQTSHLFSPRGKSLYPVWVKLSLSEQEKMHFKSKKQINLIQVPYLSIQSNFS